ncbi:hypothetical protein, partial [Litchfieldella qijiaojingensis]|uniref:hypothetical protein n=1 Tax=Litchfieldella qijiaojingensis TaxID=980347 RepID=UPI001E641835
SSWCSRTIRTARSLTSGEYFFDVVITPSSQEMESPGIPGRFSAQQNAVKVRQLPDGRIRYYEAERAARNPGPTRGSSYVTEYNPANGNVRSWNEAYDQAGNVNRVHPKMINGQVVDSQHYPPTARELGLSQ